MPRHTSHPPTSSLPFHHHHHHHPYARTATPFQDQSSSNAEANAAAAILISSSSSSIVQPTPQLPLEPITGHADQAPRTFGLQPLSQIANIALPTDMLGAEQHMVTGEEASMMIMSGGTGGKKPGACAECRRLKLGCDRNWPCGSCKRRSASSHLTLIVFKLKESRKEVAHLCPDGQLESKEINLAQKQIKGLLDRIGQLETVLSENNLAFDPFKAKDDPSFNFSYEGPSSSSSSAAAGGGGILGDVGGEDVDEGEDDEYVPSKSRSKGKTKGKARGRASTLKSSSRKSNAVSSPSSSGPAAFSVGPFPCSSSGPTSTVAGMAIDPEKVRTKGTLRYDPDSGGNAYVGAYASASHAVPASGDRARCMLVPTDQDLAKELASMPGQEEGLRLIQTYFLNCDWVHRLLDERAFIDDWHAFYADARSPLEKLPRHKLAVGLLVMALAYLSESPPPTTIPPTATTTEDAAATTTTEEDATRDVSERSDGWARTAQMCLGGVGVGFTSCVTLDTVAALDLLAQYLLNADAPESASAAWNVVGIALRLCQSMGLHYSGAWDEPEVSYRQRLWWETVALDRILSLSLGRPYMARSSQTAWPIVLDDYGYVREGVKRSFMASDFAQPTSFSFHYFKYRLCIVLDTCLDDLDSPSLPRQSVVLKTHGAILELASKVPAFLQVDLDKDPFAALLGVSEAERGKIVGQAHMLHLLIQMTMLALHRPYFIEAVKRSTEPEPETSFDACIRAAKKLTDGLKSAKRWIPKPSVFWKSFVGETFTAAVVQATTSLAAPTHPQAAASYASFGDSHALFKHYASLGHSTATRTLPTMDLLMGDVVAFPPASSKGGTPTPSTTVPPSSNAAAVTTPATSITTAGDGGPVANSMSVVGGGGGRRQRQDGSIVGPVSGINFGALLHSCARFFGGPSDGTGGGMAREVPSRPPWMQVPVPEAQCRPSGDQTLRQPGAPAALFATGGISPQKDWASATAAAAAYEEERLGRRPAEAPLPFHTTMNAVRPHHRPHPRPHPQSQSQSQSASQSQSHQQQQHPHPHQQQQHHQFTTALSSYPGPGPHVRPGNGYHSPVLDAAMALPLPQPPPSMGMGTSTAGGGGQTATFSFRSPPTTTTTAAGTGTTTTGTGQWSSNATTSSTPSSSSQPQPAGQKAGEGTAYGEMMTAALATTVASVGGEGHVPDGEDVAMG